MGAVEITIIVVAVAIVVAFIATYIVRKLKGKPTGECACCSHAKTCKKCDCQGHDGKIDLSQYLKKPDDTQNN